MIAIRVDSNDIIATGHLMRCLSIADQMENKPLFISSEESSRQFIMERGYECICLQNKYDEKELELQELLKIIRIKGIHTLLIDSYEVTEHYLHVLHGEVQLAYIDDLIQFYYDVDMIINYTYKTEIVSYEKWNYSNVEFLLGSKFVPLRRQFLQKPIKIDTVEQLLLTTGGTDKYHVILELIEALSNKNYILHIVLGKFYGDYDDLNQYTKKNSNIIVYRDVKEIANIMKKCDMAISAGGTTLAELATLGIPTICFAIADNQLVGTKMYANDGLMMYTGDIRTEKAKVKENIIRNIEYLAENKNVRKDMSNRMVEMFDGRGARRIAERLEALDNRKEG